MASSSTPPAGDTYKNDKQIKPTTIQETDTDELKRFREKWKRELQTPSLPTNFSTLPEGPRGDVLTNLSSTPLGPQKHNIAYPRSNIGENILISRFLALLEEAENEEHDTTKEGEKHVQPPPISILPAELQVAILANLDVKSLEHCSIVYRFWYILARDEGLPQFQTLCLRTWAGITTTIFESFQCDWRTMYLHRPRLRDDGIYISRNCYLRPGQTEGSYYQPVHEVVYFRYLRFLSQGTVIYALSSEAPKQVLNWFKPSAIGSAHPSHRAVHSGTYPFKALLSP